MNILVEVEVKLHTEFGRVWLKKKFLFFGEVGLGPGGWGDGVSGWCDKFFVENWSKNKF